MKVRVMSYARMLANEAMTVVAGAVVGDNLVLTKRDGTTVDAGNVRGPMGTSNPTGAAGGSLAGNYPNPTIGNGKIVLANIAASLIDAAVGTASLRTLGSGAQQAAPGNDARLSNSRTPSGAAAGVLAGTYPNPGLADTDWINLTTVNTTGGSVQYRVKGGTVFLRVSPTFASQAIGANLTIVDVANGIPAAYRPSANTLGAAFYGNSIGHITVFSTGAVQIHASSAAMTGALGIVSWPVEALNAGI